ncbi:right-handed parallel beta-helix repeat-containing protein [Methanobrevibacter sp.]
MIKKTTIMLILLFFIIIITPINANDSVDLNDTDVNSFTDLSNEITASENDTIRLTQNYTYNNETDTDYDEGVIINKSVTVIGAKNTIIDARNQARCMIIESDCNVVLKNLTFKNGYSMGNGGGILLKENSNLTLIGCIFENNVVYNSNGGALYTRSSTNTIIINTVFTNNTSIRESNLEWEEFKKGMGSAICTGINSTLELANSIFTKNRAYLATVLVISYNDRDYQLSKLKVKSTVFENNTSLRSGIIYLDEFGYGEIHDSVFRKNDMLETAGTVILDASVYALVKNCLFEENHAVRGGGINLRLYENTGSNVYIEDCNFTKNFASVTGGAIYSNLANMHVTNCNFKENEALANGGAIYSTGGIINMNNSNFTNNRAEYGGALSITFEKACINNSSFTNNHASIKGGAIYSKSENIIQNNLTFTDNTSPNGQDIYGAFNVKITVKKSYFNDVELEIKIDSVWNVPHNQSIKVKFKGTKTYTTGWLTTNNDGTLTLKNPFNFDAGKYNIEVSGEDGFCYFKDTTLNVAKAPVKLTVKKLTTSYKQAKYLKFYVINTKTNKKVAGAKLTLKLYTGKKYVSYTLTSDKKGIVKFSTSKIKAGKHTIKITAKNKNIKLTQVTSSITVKKASATLTYAKKVKKGSKIKVTVKNKNNKKVMKNTKFTIKMKGKTFKVKTNSKGLLKINTKSLKKGKVKINVIFKSANYNINKKIYVKIN